MPTNRIYPGTTRTQSGSTTYGWQGSTLFGTPSRRLGSYVYGPHGSLQLQWGNYSSGTATPTATRDASGNITFTSAPTASSVAAAGLSGPTAFTYNGQQLFAEDIGANPNQLLMNQANRKEAEAVEANERRYTRILGGYDSLKTEVEGILGDLGAGAKAEIASNTRTLGSRIRSDLVSRGLSGSTVGIAPLAANTEAGNRSLANLASQMAGVKAQSAMSIAQGKMGVMERREDTYPDMAQLLQLSQLYGRYATPRRTYS